MQASVRGIIKSFLHQCNIPYETPRPAPKFHEACLTYARRHGYKLDGDRSLKPCIPGGVVMASNAYGHIKDPSTQTFIAIYTAFMIYLDDINPSTITVVRQFNQRFVKNERQLDKVLDDLADLLHDTPNHFSATAADMILTSTLNFVTSLVLDYEMQDTEISVYAKRYPTFSRAMNGLAVAYCLFTFSKELPIFEYLQAIPDMIVYVHNTNDILSFYKEQLAGEDINYVSLLSRCHEVSKHEALSHLVNMAAEADGRVLRVLAPYSDAFNAYSKFRGGYIGFHSGLSRYKLGELGLTEETSQRCDEAGVEAENQCCRICMHHLCITI